MKRAITINKNEADRIFVVGGTGKIGSSLVHELVKYSGAHQPTITIYSRSPEIVNEQLSLIAGDDGIDKKTKNITIIQGDLEDLTPFEESIVGHTRLFLLVADVPEQREKLITLSEKAYAAGVKQIVDIEAKRISWRSYSLIDPHLEAEKAIYALPIRKYAYYVTLRPTNFMSNIFFLCLDTIKNDSVLVDAADPDEDQEWISPFDIALVAANILLDPMEKHGNAAYDLVGDIKTPLQRAASLSTALGRTITYKQLPVTEYYAYLIRNAKMDHKEAFFFATYREVSKVTRRTALLLGRAPESFEEWAFKNKNKLV
ncbi:hypothetical protein BDA99DRAFT_525350 [Phascolomyces articulosus]|uniref:NmrA-like domain-containing protein n=1 Tax=Phascolomyces articulosus TaxID=60185 RepID=A0AAD5P8N1_9FUNG|nr:hypothetical protein BDA99DRAFT_525350 [Phascolomyces articulosus]